MERTRGREEQEWRGPGVERHLGNMGGETRDGEDQGQRGTGVERNRGRGEKGRKGPGPEDIRVDRT